MTYMSTAERLVKLHDKMCDNIEAMGGTVDPTGTLIEIADAILDIPPVPVGVSIDTATTCSADKSTTTVSSPVTFTGKVSAYHDDETSANVDLIGYLKGATVKFYNGQTLLGSATTDNNGEYSFSYTPLVAGEMSVIAMFEAIEDYKQSSSTEVVITVSSYSDIVMSADKPILSYADHEKATLYAQLVDENDTPLAIEGVTLTFKKDSTILGTADTDSTGLATLVDGYTSQGVGDVTLSVTDGTFLTKTFTVEDCRKYDGASSDKTSNYSNTRIMYDSSANANYSLSFDSSNSCYKSSITDGTNGSYFLIPLTTLDSDIEISFETYGDGTNVCDSGFGVFNSSNNHSNLIYTRVHSPNDTTLIKRFTKTTSLTSWNHAYNQSESNNQYQKWIKHIISIDGLDFVYTTKDSSDNTIWTYTGSFDSEMSNKQIGLVIGWYKSITSWKNLKIKPL